MTLRATLEILIHFESFRNIDLFHQGVYMLKSYIFQEQTTEDKIIYSQPYNIVDIQKNYNSRKKSKLVLDSRLYDFEFYSKAFIIRFCDEVIDLDDICHFRAEIDAYPQLDDDNFYLVIELMYADMSTLTSENPMKNDPEPESKFKTVAKFQSQLHNSFNGIHEFIPVTFDDLHFCLVNCTVHTILLDFKFRYNPSLTTIQTLNDQQQEVKVTPKKFQDFLRNVTDNYQADQIDLFYDTYVRQLRVSYDRYLNYFKGQIDACCKNKNPKKAETIKGKLIQLPAPNYLSKKKQVEENPDDSNIEFYNLDQFKEEQKSQDGNDKKQDDQSTEVSELKEEVKSEEIFRGEEEKKEKNQLRKSDSLDEEKYNKMMSFLDNKIIDDKQTLDEDSEIVIQFAKEYNVTSEEAVPMITELIRIQKEEKIRKAMFNAAQDSYIQQEDNDSSKEKQKLLKSQTDGSILTSEEFKNDKQEDKLIPVQKKRSSASKVKKKKQDSRFTDYFNMKDEQEVNTINFEIQSEINSIAACAFQLWYAYVDMIKESIKDLTHELEQQYNSKIKDRWGESIFRNEFAVDDLSKYKEPKSGKQHYTIANVIRKKDLLTLEPLNVEDINLIPKAALHPIIFEEIYYLKQFQQQIVSSQGQLSRKKSINKGVHVWVLVHGYQGNSFDLRLFKDNLSVKFPNDLFLCSAANEDDTEGNIEDMGKRLASEVRKFLREFCPDNELGRLSFVCHSLGGLIGRSCLIHLQDFKEKFYTFLSFSTPHIGMMYHSSVMINTGLWVMKKWKKCLCLQQMTLADEKEIENTFIYKLSQRPGLNWFQNIALVGSYQDQYVPYASARIQKSPKADKSEDSLKTKKYNEMVETILRNLKSNGCYRIDVSFQIPGRSVDNFIGRAAHIQFLENQALMKMLIYTFDHLFE